MTETPDQEQAINNYQKLTERLFHGELLAMGLGLAISIGSGLVGIVNCSRNPYKSLPAVVSYSKIEQDLRYKGSIFTHTLRQIAERNPDLIDPLKIDLYVDGLKREFETLKNSSDYAIYQDWKQENVFSYFEYVGLGIAFALSSGLLACMGIWMVDKKKNKLQVLHQKFQEPQF
ncbi:hypothetical protein J4423_02535 [Candidatus Pacearchaeota archaeon]|nr:hypothetical protein [Candidatus Pacearchaeota archaeon]